MLLCVGASRWPRAAVVVLDDVDVVLPGVDDAAVEAAATVGVLV